MTNKDSTNPKDVDFFAHRSLVEMVITKASVLKDGTMRFHATCSDTEADSRGEKTTRGLFTDWMDRVEKSKTVPFLPSPRIPFLSVAHYSSMEGLGEAGIIEKGYIDGNQFKVSGLFYNDENHPCGPALFSAVQEQQEMVQKGEAIDEPIRISAAWWDLSHSHGDFVFERTSLSDVCPMCEEGKPRKFLQGQLDHMAATRVPINPRTSLELEQLSEAIRTRKEDASSMIGDDLAELLDNAYRSTEGKSAVLVSMSDKVELSFGGATTFAEADAELAAYENKEHIWNNLDMFMSIIDNIMYADETINKADLMQQAAQDLGSRISAMKSEAETVTMLLSAVKKSTGDIMTTPTQVKKAEEGSSPVTSLQEAYAAALGDTSLDRTAKFSAIQTAMEAFATEVKQQVDAVNPPDFQEELSKAIKPLEDKIDLMFAKFGTTQLQQISPVQPIQRSYAPGRSEPPMPNKPISGITALMRKSVGIVE